MDREHVVVVEILSVEVGLLNANALRLFIINMVSL